MNVKLNKMKQFLLLSLIGLTSLMLSSCVTTQGTDVATIDMNALELGSSTQDGVISMVGKPQSIEEISTNDHGTFTVVSYGFVQVDFWMGYYSKKSGFRAMDLEFDDEKKLNGYVFVTSFDAENADALIEKSKKIIKDEHRKDYVMELLGKPNAKALYPSQLGFFSEMESYEQWSWLSSKPEGNGMRSVRLDIGFDQNGKVMSISHSSKLR